MSDRLKRTIEIVNEISPSFCAAKWYNASIWLNNGRTASCHHPLAHSIPLNSLDNPSNLHNTTVKKQARKEMLEGIRPKECGYCWRVEDLNDPNIYSDRAYKSMIYTEEEISDCKIDWESNIDPKTLEVCFDNLCNLSCSYCNSEFSSSWSSDIKENGPYQNMLTPGGMTYHNDGSHSMPFGTKNENNLYVSKFFDWYNSSLRHSLRELRVSGGEPTRSPDFWRLVESFNNEKFQFAVNTNLILDETRLTKLINIGNEFDKFKFHIYTSAESFGKSGEFVRNGFNYELWKTNLIKIREHNPNIITHVMMTVSALSIWEMDLFVQDILDLREHFNTKNVFHLSVNILRFPSFHSINIIPSDIKNKLADKLARVINNTSYLSEHEINSFERLIAYLRQVDTSYEDMDSLPDKLNDFKSFVIQYSKRNNMPINEYMCLEFNEWFKTL